MKHVYFAMWAACVLFWSVWMYLYLVPSDPFAFKDLLSYWPSMVLFVLLLPCVGLCVVLTVIMLVRMVRRRALLKAELAMSIYTLFSVVCIAKNFPTS